MEAMDLLRQDWDTDPQRPSVFVWYHRHYELRRMLWRMRRIWDNRCCSRMAFSFVNEDCDSFFYTKGGRYGLRFGEAILLSLVLVLVVFRHRPVLRLRVLPQQAATTVFDFVRRFPRSLIVPLQFLLRSPLQSRRLLVA